MRGTYGVSSIFDLGNLGSVPFGPKGNSGSVPFLPFYYIANLLILNINFALHSLDSLRNLRNSNLFYGTLPLS